MRKKLLLIVIFLDLIYMPANSMEERSFNQCLPTDSMAYPVIASQSEIKARLAQFKKTESAVVMVLGAVPSESDHFSFVEVGSNVGVFYVNDRHHQYDASSLGVLSEEMQKKEWIGELVLADLNNAVHTYMELVRIFRNSLDIIVPDLNVLYFLSMSDSFFHGFSRILKVGGKMFLDYNSHLGSDMYDRTKKQIIFQRNEVKVTFYDSALTAESVGKKRGYEFGKPYIDITLGNLYDLEIPYLQCKAQCSFYGGEPTQDILDMIDAQYQTYLTLWAQRYAPRLLIVSEFGIFPYLRTTKYDYNPDSPRRYLEVTRIS